MKFKLTEPVSISKFLTKSLNIPFDKKCIIDEIAVPSCAKENSLCFVSKGKSIKCKGYVLAKEATVIREGVKIISKNPRLDFIRIVNYLKSLNLIDSQIKLDISSKAQVADYSDIGTNVTIGDNTIIESFVKIHDGVQIGENCHIKSGSVIGHNGFGFERDENNVPHEFPHLANVVIGNNVQIGAKCTVCKGALTDTIIKNNVKIDDHCHIAHGCVINENTLITAFSTISGSTKIGQNVYIAPHVAVLQNLTIGDGSYVGVGSVVIRDVDDKVMVFGSPARKVKNID